MTAIVTYLIVVGSLLHLFFVGYNRFLLCLNPGPWKAPSHYLWLLASTLLPATILLISYRTAPVQEALNWTPHTTAGRLLFAMMGISVGFWIIRSFMWLQDRVAPEIPKNLLEEEVSEPVVAPVPSSLPRILRKMDTTGNLRLVEREIAVPGLSPAFDGIRIAQVSDVHFDQQLQMENYHKSVRELVNGLEADVIVFTGDFVNRRRDISAALDHHAGFTARLGQVAVLGNHDYWTRPDRIIEGLESRGIKWLGNGGRRVLRRGGRRLVFTGTDYPWDPLKRDWKRNLRRETGDALVFLSHTPDNGPVAAREGASLILSGHNHGGHFRIPGLGPFVVPSRYGLRYAGGVYRVGPESVLNVSTGVGSGGASKGIRINCPPEICLLTLRAPVVDVMVGKVVDARQLLRESEGEEASNGLFANRCRYDS